jgi:gluconate 2-dehydrogenase gamma chain
MQNQNKEKMMLSRREALKTSSLMLGYALTASAAAAVLNGCKADKTPEWMPSNMSIDQSKLIAEVAEMIIPTTDVPGAKAALVDRFIDSMFEAYPEEERNMFLQGLSLFDTKSQELNQKSFMDSDEAGRKAVLDNMVAESKSSDAPHIFDMVKEMTVLGYCTSEIGATELLNYDPIPGPFVGCVDFSTVGATWAI